MDRATYKAGRRMIVAAKVAEILEGLYGLRLVACQEAELEEMMTDEDNEIEWTPEDEAPTE